MVSGGRERRREQDVVGAAEQGLELIGWYDLVRVLVGHRIASQPDDMHSEDLGDASGCAADRAIADDSEGLAGEIVRYDQSPFAFALLREMLGDVALPVQHVREDVLRDGLGIDATGVAESNAALEQGNESGGCRLRLPGSATTGVRRRLACAASWRAAGFSRVRSSVSNETVASSGSPCQLPSRSSVISSTPPAGSAARRIAASCARAIGALILRRSISALC